MSTIKRTSVLSAILIPPIIFYTFLAKSLTSLPFGDDYETVLGFLLQWHKQSGIKHLVQVVTFQHNDYRCMFENSVVGIQYALLGHTNLRALAILGDLLVIPLFGVLFLIWRECGRPREYTLLAFVPVSWILFQLQYEGTLNFATSGLQCIPVVIFALLTCLLATKTGIAAFWGTILNFLLCIASYANGLFLIPIGAAIYLQRREYSKLVTWFCVSGIACLIYFRKYDFSVETSNVHSTNNVYGLLEHISPVYAVAFLGSIASIRNPMPAVLLGSALTVAFILATRDQLFSRRPAIFYSCLFIFITGITVSGLRSGFGLVQALDSRYRINSTVLLILIYLYLADKLYGVRVQRLILTLSASILGVLLVGFNLASNYAGGKFLLARRNALEVEMVRWERHEPSRPIGPSFLTAHTTENARFLNHWQTGLYDPIEPFISDSIREGIYKLPNLPEENQFHLDTVRSHLPN